VVNALATDVCADCGVAAATCTKAIGAGIAVDVKVAV
jgi:hypothetical protein